VLKGVDSGLDFAGEAPGPVDRDLDGHCANDASFGIAQWRSPSVGRPRRGSFRQPRWGEILESTDGERRMAIVADGNY
jgi:hypothetical protein